MNKISQSKLSKATVKFEETKPKSMSTTPKRKMSSDRVINRHTSAPKSTSNKTVTKPKNKFSFKEKVKNITNAVKNTVNTAVTKVKSSNKARKKRTKSQRQTVKRQRLNVIMGIGLLLVLVSIAYSTYIVRTFVDTNESLFALAPQVSFAVIISIIAFSKLYK